MLKISIILNVVLCFIVLLAFCWDSLKRNFQSAIISFLLTTLLWGSISVFCLHSNTLEKVIEYKEKTDKINYAVQKVKFWD